MIKFREIKYYLTKKENIYYTIFILLIFYLDRSSKNQILNNFNETSFFINDFLNLDLIWNTGIGFGLLSTNSALSYNIVTTMIGAVILILIFLSLISKKTDKIIYCTIIGGALGNFYDRIVFKAVPDFIDLHFNNFHWFTFNLADVFITLGVIFFMFKNSFANNK